MAISIKYSDLVSEKEARLVGGMMQPSRRTQYELYAYCSDYFWENYRGVFFSDEETAAEILQNSFITLWENIEVRKIYAEEGVVKGKDGEPLKGSILTYFMSIARFKYMEYVRDRMVISDPEIEQGRTIREEGGCLWDDFYNPDEDKIIEMIAEIISRMSPRCSEILTKFYYEEKTLDAILKEIPEIESYNALKTKKNKCMSTLRETAFEMRKRMMNS
ncbi:MAG: RNA polymerase sigma factor [Muribaculaceae bacterium]